MDMPEGLVPRPCGGEVERQALVRIWRSSVEATHDLLAPEDADFYGSRMLGDYLPSVALTVAEIENHPDLRLDVNEQNPQAVGFYRRHGFVVLGRSATDGDGRPFPVLHLGSRLPLGDTPSR